MSAFGTSNHTPPLLPSVGRRQSSAAADVLRTSFVAVLEESKQKRDEPPERIFEQKRSLEGITQRKSLDNREIEASLDRNRQLDGEYQHRLDRRDCFHDKPVAEPVPQTPDVTVIPSGVLPMSLPVSPPNIVWTQQSMTSELPVVGEPSTIQPPAPASVDSSPPLPFSQSATLETPILAMVSTPTALVDPMPKPPPDLSTLTIFNVSGRFGNEKRDKDTADRKTEKRGVSLFGSLLPLVDDGNELPSKPPPAARHSKLSDEVPERQPVEPANVELPKKGTKGIPLEELLGLKAFVRANEPSNVNLNAEAETQADRKRFVQRVAAACQAAANRSGTVRIKLHPEVLGPLTVRVSTKKGKLSVHFETETDEAKRLLAESLGDLKARLRTMHYELDDCRID